MLPSEKATFKQNYLEYPTSFGITVLDPSSLFAEKINAILFQNWKNRAKGRDFYDYAFYIRKGIKPNIPFIAEQIQRKEGISSDLSWENISERLKKRFSEIDFALAKKDVLPFISDTSRLQVWSSSYFAELTDKIYPKL